MLSLDRNRVLYFLIAEELECPYSRAQLDGIVIIDFLQEVFFVRDCDEALVLDPVVDIFSAFTASRSVPARAARLEHHSQLDLFDRFLFCVKLNFFIEAMQVIEWSIDKGANILIISSQIEQVPVFVITCLVFLIFSKVKLILLTRSETDCAFWIAPTLASARCFNQAQPTDRFVQLREIIVTFPDAES